MRKRNRRRSLRASVALPVVLENRPWGPWLHDDDSPPPAELAPEPATRQRAKRKLAGSRRRITLSTGGIGITLPPASDLLPRDRVMVLLALGPRRRPLTVLAGVPARVVRAREILDGLEVGLAFETPGPAIERRLGALIQARERRGRG